MPLFLLLFGRERLIFGDGLDEFWEVELLFCIRHLLPVISGGVTVWFLTVSAMTVTVAAATASSIGVPTVIATSVISIVLLIVPSSTFSPATLMLSSRS